MDKSQLLELLRAAAPRAGELVPSTSDVSFEEIGDGNLNFVYRLSTEATSVIVKHAPTYIRCLGPSYSLTQDRLEFEYRCLERFHAIHPGSCPQPYYYDKMKSSVVMEDLKGHRIMRYDLMEGKVNLEAVRCVAKFAAHIHCATLSADLSESDQAMLLKDFENPVMVQLTKDYIFTKPYIAEDETNSCNPAHKDLVDAIRQNETMQSAIKELRRKFAEEKTCLCHGDLHSGSIMVKEASAKVIDCEFAFVGPPAFDLGLLLAHYVISYLAHCTKEHPNSEYLRQMLQAVELTWDEYTSHNASTKTEEIPRFMEETLGFLACEILRRVIGAAPVADVKGNTSAENHILLIGTAILDGGQKKIQTVSQLIAECKRVTEK